MTFSDPEAGAYMGDGSALAKRRNWRAIAPAR
jgi:hypothetical protein